MTRTRRGGGRLESWWNFCTQERIRSLLRKTRYRNRSLSMPSTALPPEKQAEIEALARAIHQAVDGEISELAANLATPDDAHLFGDNAFTLRTLAHKIAARAIDPHLAHRQTDMRAPARPAPPARRALSSTPP